MNDSLTERRKLTAKETEVLLGKLCTVLGFCLPPEAEEQLINDPPPTAAEFAEAVYFAEGLTVTDIDLQVFRQMKTMINDGFQNSSLNL